MTEVDARREQRGAVPSPPPLIGILVGGRGRRMGGVAKGNLRYRGIPLIERLIATGRAAAGGAAQAFDVALVGQSEAYAVDSVARLEDHPAGIGPLGGLRALLVEAQAQGRQAIALAVDLPYVELALLRRLMVEHPAAAALAPRREGRWEPLFARYCPGPALVALDAALADGRRALQSVFDGLGAAAVELPLSELDWPLLRDWDRPDDVSGVYQE